MEVMESGIVTDDNPIKPEQRFCGIYLTLLPKVKLVIFLQPEKGQDPTDVQLSALNTTEVRPVQPEKASPPMLVTEFGIVTEVRPLQS